MAVDAVHFVTNSYGLHVALLNVVSELLPEKRTIICVVERRNSRTSNTR